MRDIFYSEFLADDEIPLLKPAIGKDVLADLEQVFASGWVGEGEWVRRFEHELARYLEVAHVVCVNSGTTAITLALDLLDLGAGDTVISTPITCAATNFPLIHRNIHIRWADVDPDNGLLSPESVIANIDGGTKAILAVDLHGFPSYYSRLRDIADRYGLVLIADCAQGIGARYRNEQTPFYADISCFSFQAVKSLTTVDGGAVVFNDPAYLDRARRLCWFGIDREQKARHPRPWSYDIEVIGYKYHMNNVNAAIGLCNMRHLGSLLAHQQATAQFYGTEIQESDFLRRAVCQADQHPTFWVYPLLVANRNRFVAHMKATGVAVSPLHQANSRLTVFERSGLTAPSRDGDRGTELINDCLVCLPTGYWVDQAGREKVATAVNAYRPDLGDG